MIFYVTLKIAFTHSTIIFCIRTEIIDNFSMDWRLEPCSQDFKEIVLLICYGMTLNSRSLY